MFAEANKKDLKDFNDANPYDPVLAKQYIKEERVNRKLDEKKKKTI